MSSKGLSASSVRGRRSRTLSNRSILLRLEFDISDEEQDEKSSPHHTRSGRVWTEGEGSARPPSRRRTKVRRSQVSKVVTDGDVADIEGVDEDFSANDSEVDDRYFSNTKTSLMETHRRSQPVVESSPPRLLEPTPGTITYEPVSSPAGRPYILTTSPSSFNTPIYNHKALLESPRPGTPRPGTPRPSTDALRYKVGDLGHVVSIDEDIGGSDGAEEGDCRYMAPEFLSMEPIEGTLLPKCDMFSVGLTVYEAASLLQLPSNSSEGPEYEELKAGKLGPLPAYSKDFRAVLSSLCSKDPVQRPTTGRVIAHPALNPSAVKSKAQLRKELKLKTRKVRELEEALRRGSQHVGGSLATKSMPKL